MRLARLLALASAVPPKFDQRRLASVVASANGQLTVPCRTEADTAALGAAIAAAARAGDVVLLRGDYGAGKTCLARGFLRRWLADPNELVTSPSYLIDNVYPDEGRALQPGVTVHHMDLWRLPEGKASQLIDLDHVFTECVSLIEWPDRLGDAMPAEHLAVHLAIGDSNQGLQVDEEVGPEDQPRIATLTAVGGRWEHVLTSNAQLQTIVRK